MRRAAPAAFSSLPSTSQPGLRPPRPLALALALAGVVALAAPTSLAAQQGGEPAQVLSTASLGLYSGVATFGRLLEQRVNGRQRELTAGADVAVGTSFGFSPWEKTGLRAAFTWSPATLAFEDDTGDGGRALARDGVLEMDAFVVTGELVRFIRDPEETLAPYAMAGLSWTHWRVQGMDAQGDIVAPDESYGRFGATGSVGLQIRASDRLDLRLELTTAELGNPFEGEESLHMATGVTFGEPSRVNRTALSVGVIYSLTGR